MPQSNVQAAVKNRLLDSSPAVRDAAVELLGKYLTQHPELIDDYYTQIGARIGVSGRALPVSC
jgi:cohesin loading factor subunit SCC2